MKLKEIKKLTKDQLHKNLDKFKKDLFNLRFRKINGQLTNPSKFKETKKAIANFKTKKDMPIGCKVTLRRKRMYEFIDRLINIALPRTKDFSGLSEKNFDGLGNYTFGIKEHIIFPEIDYDKIDKVKGMDITIVTSTKNNNEAKSLLKAFNFPLNK